FRIGRVVTRTLLNIIEKAALSPFSLLGAMFGGNSETLDHQEFAAGDTALTAEDTNKLEVLAKALYERPALQMEIAGSVDPEGDREGLQRMAIDREIRSRLWAGLRKSSQATNSADQIVIPAEDRPRWVKKLFGEASAAGKITPQLIAENTNLAVYAAVALPKSKTSKGATQLFHKAVAAGTNNVYRTMLVPPPDATEALLMATIPVTENDLETLAATRARVVQAYLLKTGKVDAGRLFLKESTPEGLRRDGCRVYFQFR
ncbi:MAG TPA: hypothetical protein VN625_05640, partial [Desulfuromonadaceae bacterium]|nr:hypothetical protein [Desulfuromonadaceae bacterium]